MNEVFALVILGVILISGAIVLDHFMPPLGSSRTSASRQGGGSVFTGCSVILTVVMIIGLLITLFDGDGANQ